MAIVGNIIKGVIHLKSAITPEVNHVTEQQKVLSELLEKAKNTAFGKAYNFASILTESDMERAFAQNVPYFDYHSLHEKWWHRVIAGEENICWPGSPEYFALSSGTTGKKSKRIPVTNEMLESIRKAGIKQVFAMSNFDLPADFFEGELMMLGSSTDLDERGDFKEGEISGIGASNIPGWMNGYYKPGKEIAKIDNWDERVLKIAKNAHKWNIVALSGIPSWMELMLQKVIDYNKLNNIHDIWPNLQVFTSGGVAFGPYEKSFNALLGQEIIVIDTYLASEGFIACQTRPETDAMELITNNGIYYEFVPFEPEYINQDGSIIQDAPVVGLADVELNKDYILIISTVSGAWRYLIGDTIEFTDIKRAEIKITGRTKFFLNVVGSQLSVNKLDKAIKHLEEKYKSCFPEYTLCAKRGEDGEFYHFWTIGAEDVTLNEEKIAKELDKYLQSANKNYRVARTKALKGVKIELISPCVFYEWSGANKKKGGQVKMERVMSEEKYGDWENFVSAMT